MEAADWNLFLKGFITNQLTVTKSDKQWSRPHQQILYKHHNAMWSELSEIKLPEWFRLQSDCQLFWITWGMWSKHINVPSIPYLLTCWWFGTRASFIATEEAKLPLLPGSYISHIVTITLNSKCDFNSKNVWLVWSHGVTSLPFYGYYKDLLK